MPDIPLMENPMTTAEDIIKGGASGAPARLAAGSEGQVLQIASGAVAWGAGGSGTPSMVGAQVYDSAGQALTASTFTTLTFDSETYDTDAFHTGSGSKLTVPSGKDGYYLIVGHVQFGANSTADRIIGIRKNGSGTTSPDLSYVRHPVAQSGSNPTRLETIAIAYLVATDWVELIAYTGGTGTSTGAGAINYFAATLLGT